MNKALRVFATVAVLTLGGASLVVAQTAPAPTGGPTPSTPATATTTTVTTTPSTPSAPSTPTTSGSSKDSEEGDTHSTGRDGGFLGKLIQNVRASNEVSRASSGRNEGGFPSGRNAQTIVQQIVQSVAQNTIVVPNASAPRVLEGATSTESNAQAAVQSAQFIEKVRDAAATSSSSIRDIVQSFASHEDTPKTPSLPSFLQSIRDNASSSSSAPIATIIQTVVSAIQNATATPNRIPDNAPSSRGDSRADQGASTTYSDLPKASSDGAERQDTKRSASDAAQQIQQLEQISQTVNTINTAKQKVAEQVHAVVSRGVDQTVSQAIAQASDQQSAQPSTTAFSEAERQAKLAQIKAQAQIQGQQIATQVAQSVAQGSVLPQQVDPVLKSSLQDIAALVQADSGVPVSVPALQNRDVAQQIQNAAQDIKQAQDTLAQRDGLDLYRDSDHDGISDYDEVHIYHTDPYNAYTGGGSLTDGERVLLGLDPHSKSPAPVPVQDPKIAGATTTALFAVTNIAYVQQGSVVSTTQQLNTSSAPATPATPATPASGASSAGVSVPATTSAIASSQGAPAASPAAQATPASPNTQPAAIRFSGQALPNSFVTIYVFSTPIVVTVKTDNNGLWTYTLDQPLEDGQHEMYVATVDDSGHILAKSPAVPFTKTAEALNYEPLTIQEVSGPSPLDILRQNFLVSAGVLLAIFVLIGLLTVGFWRERTPAL